MFHSNYEQFGSKMQYDSNATLGSRRPIRSVPSLMQTQPLNSMRRSHMANQNVIPRTMIREGDFQNHVSDYNKNKNKNKFDTMSVPTVKPLNESFTSNINVNYVRGCFQEQTKDNLNTSARVIKKRNNTTIDTSETNVQKKIMHPRAIRAASADMANISTSTHFDANQVQSSENMISNLNLRVYGSTENEKIFIFTGTVERIIRWNRIFTNHFCFFEVIASLISIQEGSVKTQKIMLLRDKKGPILQVIYYSSTHIAIEDFQIGQVLRCIGKMSGPNILNAVSIRTAKEEEIETLQRLCLVCDNAVSHFLNV